MTARYHLRMTPEVEVDPDLAARAADVAQARGERLEDVIDRALRIYVLAESKRAD